MAIDHFTQGWVNKDTNIVHSSTCNQRPSGISKPIDGFSKPLKMLKKGTIVTKENHNNNNQDSVCIVQEP